MRRPVSTRRTGGTAPLRSPFSVVRRLFRRFSHTEPVAQPTIIAVQQGHAELPGETSSEDDFTKPSLADQIPKGSWDSHMHVIDASYPLAPDAVYRPSSFTLQDALSFESSVGMGNIVLVQPSIYGFDNSCLLDALKLLGPERGRGVVCFDPETTTSNQLEEWHAIGVRGVRLNITSHGKAVDTEVIARRLRQYADAVRHLGWAVQVYVPMEIIQQLEPIIPSLNVRFCIDHLGYPSPAALDNKDPYQMPGFESLARLLANGHTYVKLSAPYRLSQVHNHTDLEPAAKEIIRLAGKQRVVFATDWPHTRFEGLNIRPWLETVINWCNNDEILKDRLFKGNAEDLWDVSAEQGL